MGSSEFHFLYKYRLFNEHLFSMLINSEVYFSDPLEFNDPFDSQNCLRITSEFYEDPEQYLEPILKKMEETDPRLSSLFRKSVRQEVLSGSLENLEAFVKASFGVSLGTSGVPHIGTFCLSQSCTNLAQWSYYAANHTGLCLEFKPEGPIFETISPVKYLDEIVSYLPSEMFSVETIAETLIRKATCWRHEQEVRCLTNTGPGTKRFDKKILSRIIFGYKASSTNKKIVENILRNNDYDTKICVAEPHKNGFGVEIIPVEEHERRIPSSELRIGGNNKIGKGPASKGQHVAAV